MEYSYLNGNLKDEFYREGIYVGYRYFDSFGKEPLYPFGFGLSYTDFSVETDSVQVSGKRVSVFAKVQNIGERFSGKETVQLYVSAPNGRLYKEYQSLAAFAKTKLLSPGETEMLTLSFSMEDLASYEEVDSRYVLEAGDYILRLGNSSRAAKPVAVLRLDREVTVSEHEAVCPLNRPMTEMKVAAFAFDSTGDLPRYELKAKDFETARYRYETPEVNREPRVRALLESLSLEEMADIVVGAGMFGKSRFDLPGSVGNTTSRFWDRGLANVALCDGPAGLRIQSRSALDKKGRIKPLQMSLSVLEMLPEIVKKPMLGDPEKDTPLYQYSTAFPVATALAQTWNAPLLREIGQAV